jgi:phospholipid-binding lipoprotein MlaA
MSKYQSVVKILFSLFIWVSFSNLALANEDDHFEAYNRSAFILNQNLDEHIIVPIAKIYRYVLPHPVRTSVTHFFDNIDEVPIVVNDVLQASFLRAMSDAWRFAINSTLGIFGIFDVAAAMGLQPHYTDFGLTLAKWGWSDSSYLVLPILGPSTLRDGGGLIINYFSFSVYQYINPFAARAELLSLNLLNLRADALDFATLMQTASFDPYVFQRNTYLQHRQYRIQQTLEEKPFSIPNDTVPWKDKTPSSWSHKFR